METKKFSVDERWLAREPFEAGIATRPLAKKRTADEKELIEAALAEARGRVSGPSGAAVKLSMPASTLESKIRSLKINKQLFKTA
jgi:DNA-binding NtrC family response regulator